MQLVEINAVPSQQFSVTLGGNNYDIKIYSIDRSMAYDLDINSQRLDNDGVWLISGFKLVNDVPLLPYPRQEIGGNLLLQISDDELPDYTRFGLSQFLYYLTSNESDIYRGATNL